MPLADSEIDWFARQIIVPGVGATGQRALLRSRAWVCGDDSGRESAALYLESAGVTVAPGGTAGLAGADVALIAEPSSLDAESKSRLADFAGPVFWYALDGRRLTTGFSPAGATPALSLRRERLRERPAPFEVVAHRVAGADAAAAAVRFLLGWQPARGFEVVLV